MKRQSKPGVRQQVREIEVVQRADGLFDVLLNRVRQERPFEEWSMQEILCVRFGYCGEEFESILKDVRSEGSKTLYL
jgi:hypothetical protein